MLRGRRRGGGLIERVPLIVPAPAGFNPMRGASLAPGVRASGAPDPTPATILDLDFGWESDAGAQTLASSDTKVAAMADHLSSHGRNLAQATGANQPGWVTGALNGKPAARFQSTFYLAWSSPWAQRVAATGYAVLASTGTTLYCTAVDRAGGGPGFLAVGSAANRPSVFNGAVPECLWGSASTAWKVVCWGYDQTPASGSRISRVQVGADTVVTNSVGTGATGQNWTNIGRSSAAAGCDWQLAALYLVNGWRTDEQHTAMLTYLSAKYGAADIGL